MELPISLLRHSKIGLSTTLILLISLYLISSFLSAAPSKPAFAPQMSVFSRNGAQLIFVNAVGNEIITQHTLTGKIIKRTPFTLAAGSTLLAPTPDGFKLLAAHAKGIDVIHNGTGKVLRTLPHPSGRYDWKGLAIKQNADGSLLAIPSLRNTAPKIYLIHTGTGKIIRTINLVNNAQRWRSDTKIGSLGFSDNKRFLAYTLYRQGNAILSLYDINQQKAMGDIEIKHTTKTAQETLHFNRNNNKIVISGIHQRHISVLDLKKKTQNLLTYPYSCFTHFSADNKSLLIIQPYKNSIILRNIATGKQQQHTLPRDTAHAFASVIQSNNKAFLALALRSASLKDVARFLVINAQTRKVLR